MTANELMKASFIDVGILDSSETLTAYQAQDGLRRLNNMVAGWRTQFGTVLAIERQVFALVADKQTYSIGLGGDFNIPRPMGVVGAGLWLSGLSSAQSVSGITRSGLTATVSLASHGFAVGDEALIAGATQIDYNGLQTVTSIPTSGTFTYTLDARPTTPATGTITSSAVSGTPVEIPRTVITDDAYQAIQIKGLSNALFTNVYYNPTFPLGTIFLWPKPDTADNQLVLYLQNVFGGFADYTTDYDYPDLPGYAEALEYNLAVRLAEPYGRECPDRIERLADHTLGLIKRANNKLSDLPSDAPPGLTKDRRAGYNISSGQGG